MPRATSSGTNPLRRNQACRQCRRKKLKCDAARPHCGTCVKTWKGKIAVAAPPGYIHDPQPDCDYDPGDGASLIPTSSADPTDRVKFLEAQVLELKNQLARGHPNPAYPSPPPPHVTLGPSDTRSPFSTHSTLSTPSVPGPSTPSYSNRHLERTEIVVPESVYLSDRPTNIVGPTPIQATYTNVHRRLDLVYSGWPADLPHPAEVRRLVSVFFQADQCGSRMIHRPSLMAALALPADHKDFPHTALLHAICTTASRWVSGYAERGHDGLRRDPFAEFHAKKVKLYIAQAMTSGFHSLDLLQACILLSWHLYMEGHWAEAWMYVGLQSRASIPFRLNFPGCYYEDELSGGSFLPPPTSALELEKRRRIWWMIFIMDRTVSSSGWSHALPESDAGTEFPMRLLDFQAEHPLPPDCPQSLRSPKSLITHIPEYTDSFTLLLKANILYGKVMDFNTQQNIRKSSLTNRSDLKFSREIRNSAEFQALDRLVAHDFIENIPHGFRNLLGVGEIAEWPTFDVDLYLAHLLPHAATIALHNAFMDLSDANDLSTRRCQNAANQISHAYVLLESTSFEIRRLHPSVVVCWYLAAVFYVQICRHFVQTGSAQAESETWTEINKLRLAMLEYGAQSPIGCRQEKLLQDILTDILKLTTTENPLKNNIPFFAPGEGVSPSASLGSQGGGPVRSPHDHLSVSMSPPCGEIR
ncbi:hypothetical protein SISSUDRAFT_1012646 [Sistotremastrum suecicum HHB10207 ss-3]|uniref:Zn(2)-C6 fungal-type domain-containing protein n=1 Tax=Sistotremastrum suecicum HHB10207 ss-3 TaxID=1314776 RepID=A0A166J876_9AGAM|nr:hypothetical protein SISSUDRAFT_1012646 [Sistotremastrum suecicum HHB10207 ss-3]